MKKYLLLILLASSAGASQLSAQVLTNFSTGGVNPFQTSDLEAPWVAGVNSTIGSDGLTVTSVSNQVGGIFDTLESGVTVTNFQFLTLTGILQAAPAVQGFQIQVFDSAFDSKTYQFNWNNYNATTGNAFTGVYLPGDDSGTFSGPVDSFALNLGGSIGDTVSYKFQSLAFTATFVPEPSTYAMFGFGLFMLYFVYRRKAKAQTVRA